MKKLIFLAIISMCVVHASAQCIEGDCENGKGTYIFKSGAKYVGTFKESLMDGKGAFFYTDGRRFVGDWTAGRQDGYGIMYYPDEREVGGNWAAGKFLDGTLPPLNPEEEIVVTEEKTQPDRQCQYGDCENGNGVMLFNDGTVYEGYFVNGKFDGFGIFYETGAQSQGLWQEGIFKSAIANDEVGCVWGDCDNGEGTYITSDGSKYFGGFLNENFSGFGICHYSGGEKYYGSWKGAVYNGEGVLYLNNYEPIDGIWENGEFKQPKDENYVNTTKSVPFDEEINVWAVIVGVAKYDHMPTLNYTDDDAYRLAMFLRSPEGGALRQENISILIDEDATRNNILNEMTAVFNKADSNDVVMLYFSGHGLQGMFLPFDYDGINNRLSHEEVKQIFESSQAKHKICIADACHSGSLNTFTARSVNSNQLIQTYYEAFAESKGGTALLLSSKASETSLESSGLRQGIFSHYLIKGLGGEADMDDDHIITLVEMFDYIYERVRKYSGNTQTPVLKGTFDEKMPLGVIGR